MKANKWFLLFLAVCLVFSFAACGGGGGGSDTTADNGDDPAGGGNGGGSGGGSGGGNSAPAGPWLCFTALTAGSTVSTTNYFGTVANTPSIEFSRDGEYWESFTLNTGNDETNTKIILANVGDKVYLRATDTNDSFSESGKYIKFTMGGSIAASGNIMSLLDKTCTSTTIPCNDCFSRLFSGCSILKTAPELPAITLKENCYKYMFYNCSSLTTASPELPATTLENSCYYYMFYNCSSLSVPPKLQATTLANNCYDNMFSGCTNLTTSPTLLATTLALGCYAYMFYNCSSLTTAPELPATTLVGDCYYRMFEGCTSLNSITVHFEEWTPANATERWVYNVANSGEFHCRAGLNTTSPGISKNPSGWTVIKDVPEPAP